MKTIDLLDEKANPIRIIWYLAWPTMLEQILLTLVSYVDTAMVGSLGPDATASIAVCASSTWLINGIFAAIGIGFGVLAGRSLGAGDRIKTAAVMRQGVIATVALGALFTGLMQLIAPHLPVWLGAEPAIRADATAYIRIVGAAYIFSLGTNICSNIIRCSGDTKTPLIFNTATNLINVALNFLFIYPTRTLSIFGWDFTMWGAGMGVKGAALATSISIAFSGFMLLRAMYVKTPVTISLRDSYKPDWPIIRQMCSLGAPVALERITLSTGQIALTAIITGLGTNALAAHHLAVTAEGMTYLPAFGISAAATTLVAQSLGAKKPALAQRYGKYTMIGGLIFMTVMGVVLFFTAEPLISLFTPAKDVVALGGSVLRLEAFAQPFTALSMVAFGAMRGAGDTKRPFIICAIAMWAIRIPLAFVLARYTGLGLTGAWIAMVADLAIRGAIALACFLRGRWVTAWRDKGEAAVERDAETA